ncbi:D-isomer-specific 2-hydroxyacid dehydrogenase-like protein [Annulohypoxylon maeteangense]|uniref:D-isomer-specific 2-hydroxyacid dehydrogenase-like protein n=1 Tax=Annulohypoxylon maeteangense TaxID=1927788 RepID=UPI002008AFD1|nr:D-isomer-specific 2-hydroxyacid dehydrogenase-like protein [Annulohypoxylon maeteangense]KAI0881480.1 D-isomer-specific 2-hydroxyacid dehydrogenase-like protein [Annulohypoxylon maeteangense]
MAVVKIAVLDDYQKLSVPLFEKLQTFGFEVTTFTDTLLPYNHPDTPQDVKDALVKRLEPFGIISSMRERTPFPAELVNRLPNLKLLLTTGSRNASINVHALSARGIPVAGTVPEKWNPDSTTQHCVALILALARNIPQDDAIMKAGGWQTASATNLAGKVFGVVGLGRLGVSVSRIMHIAFGMKVIAWSTNLTQEAADEKAKASGLPVEDANGDKTFKVVSRDELFSSADVVSVQLVLSDRSRGLITADDLGKLKRSALFINTARGPIVVEEDLLEVAKKGLIRGVGLDVYEIEPLPTSSEWRKIKWGEEGRTRVVLSPHMGYVQDDTIIDMYKKQVENILRWHKGEAMTIVYSDNGY